MIRLSMRNLQILASKLRKASAQLPYLPRAVGLVWGVARGWTIAWLILLIVQGFLPVAIVYLTKLVVDGIVESGNHDDLIDQNGRYAESWMKQMRSAEVGLPREA